MPGMKVITEVFPDKTARKYQIDDNGVVCHCGEFTGMDIRMTLPDDYILYPLGAVEGGLYRYRVSYKGIKGTVNDEEEWIHVDYFEDEETRLPKTLISDNNILQVESMLVGDEMDSFSSTGLLMDTDSFKSCLIHTKAAYSNNYEKYVNGDIDFFTGPNTTATESEIERYQEEWSSWNWTHVPYPPRDSNYASMKMYDVDYYSRTYVNATFNPTTYVGTYLGLNAFGDWLASILMSREELSHLSESTNTTSRHLLAFTIKTNPLDIDIDLEFMYLRLYESGSSFRARGGGTGCYGGVVCADGSISTNINSDGTITGVGGCIDLTIKIPKSNLETNVGEICYEVRLQEYMTIYGFFREIYFYYPLTHIITLSNSYNAFDQAEISFELKVFHTAKRVTLRYPNPIVDTNRGHLSLGVKVRLFIGIGYFGWGKWETVFTWNPTLKSW